MIQQALNGMIAIMLARFMLNDVPHALGMLPPPAYNSIEPYQGEPGGTSTRRAIRVVPPTPTRLNALREILSTKTTEEAIAVRDKYRHLALTSDDIEVIDRHFSGLKSGNPGHVAKWIPPEEKYRLVKRTRRGSLVAIQREGNKAVLEIPNLEDMNDISNLLSASGIKWSTQSGISKPTWEGTPAYLREPRDVSGGYPGVTITFDYSDLEKIMEGRILQPLMLE